MSDGDRPSNERIVLLRAIGPTTHKRMSMAELRDACEREGFEHVRTILATGNLLVSSSMTDDEVREAVRTIVRSHGLDNDVFVRRPDELAAIRSADPMPEAAVERPNYLLVLFMHKEPDPAAVEALCRHPGPEAILVQGREVFIDYREGVGRSKLTAAVLERRLGQPGTARNWNTVGRLLDAAG